jgi:hypothetical protein
MHDNPATQKMSPISPTYFPTYLHPNNHRSVFFPVLLRGPECYVGFVGLGRGGSGVRPWVQPPAPQKKQQRTLRKWNQRTHCPLRLASFSSDWHLRFAHLDPWMASSLVSGLPWASLHGLPVNGHLACLQVVAAVGELCASPPVNLGFYPLCGQACIYLSSSSAC